MVLQCVTNLLSGKEKYVSPLTSLYPQAAQILRLGPGLLSMSPDTASAVETTNKVITKRHIPALIKRSTGFELSRALDAWLQGRNYRSAFDIAQDRRP